MTTEAATLEIDLHFARPGGFRLDVKLTAPPGITILFGPSGSGKSTTLAAVAGLIRPDAGRIALGDDVWFDSARRLHRPSNSAASPSSFSRSRSFRT